MSTIRPISDLRNHAGDISRLCHSTAEPVFITKNGREDLVLMSQAVYDQQLARLELYAELGVAEAESTAKRGTIGHVEMMRRLKSRFLLNRRPFEIQRVVHGKRRYSFLLEAAPSCPAKKVLSLAREFLLRAAG